MWGMKSTLPEFHEKYSEFEIFLVAASWCFMFRLVELNSRRSAGGACSSSAFFFSFFLDHHLLVNHDFFDDKRPAYFMIIILTTIVPPFILIYVAAALYYLWRWRKWLSACGSGTILPITMAKMVVCLSKGGGTTSMMTIVVCLRDTRRIQKGADYSSFDDNYCLYSRHDMYREHTHAHTTKNRQHPVARRTNALENMRDWDTCRRDRFLLGWIYY